LFDRYAWGQQLVQLELGQLVQALPEQQELAQQTQMDLLEAHHLHN